MGEGTPEEGAVAPPVTTPPPYADTSEPFPPARYLSYDQNDIGSAGRDGTGNTRYIAVSKGGITVLGLTMGEVVEGRINFGVTANQIVGADLRLWDICTTGQHQGVRGVLVCRVRGVIDGAVTTVLSSQSGRQVLRQHSGLLVRL